MEKYVPPINFASRRFQRQFQVLHHEPRTSLQKFKAHFPKYYLLFIWFARRNIQRCTNRILPWFERFFRYKFFSILTFPSTGLQRNDIMFVSKMISRSKCQQRKQGGINDWRMYCTSGRKNASFNLKSAWWYFVKTAWAGITSSTMRGESRRHVSLVWPACGGPACHHQIKHWQIYRRKRTTPRFSNGNNAGKNIFATTNWRPCSRHYVRTASSCTLLV